MFEQLPFYNFSAAFYARSRIVQGVFYARLGITYFSDFSVVCGSTRVPKATAALHSNKQQILAPNN